jgi:hypothetical protein
MRENKSKKKSVKSSAKKHTPKPTAPKVDDKTVIKILPRILSDENTSAGLYNLISNTLVELSNEVQVGICNPAVAPVFYYMAKQRKGATQCVKEIREIIRLAQQGETFDDAQPRDLFVDWQDRRAGRLTWKEKNAAEQQVEESYTNLARHLSAVLNDPQTPADIYNELADKVAHLSDHYLESVRKTPDFIEKCLIFAATGQAAESTSEGRPAEGRTRAPHPYCSESSGLA